MFSLNNIVLRRGSRILFDDASLNIFVKQKIGVIGANGSGKSTLFAMLLGQVQPDAGDINVSGNLRVAHLSQETPALDIPALEYVKKGDQELCEIAEQLQIAEQQNDHEKLAELHARFYDIDGYTANARAARLLNGLGFAENEFMQPVKAFSGGWRMRLNLAQALMCPSDVLLLDEPTNHLDLEAILWLENFLKAYTGTLLIISHDREFLDAIVDRIIHIEQANFKVYGGNYSAFEKLRAEYLARQQATYEKQQKQIAHMMEFVNRFRYKASKAKQAQSRLKAVDRLEIVSAVQVESPFHFEFKESTKCGNPLLRLDRVDAGYGDKTVLKNLNLSISPGARIGLLGPNGAGKSTFVKLLAGQLQPQHGSFEKGSGLKIGYYAQHQLELLHLDESPLQHLKNLDQKATEQQLRTFLGGFDFYGDVALGPIAHFSGGEKARLALALLIWQAPNLILLDEPTNHLDLEMRNALTLALQSYQGAMIVISHDRYLLTTTVDEFMLIANRQIVNFTGTIENYQMELEKLTKISEKNNITIASNSQEKNSGESKSKLENKIKKLETDLSRLQAELVKIEQDLTAPEIYHKDQQASLAEKLQLQKKLKDQLAALEENWLKLHHELGSV